MNQTPVAPSHEIREICQLRIERLLKLAAHVNGALVATADGFDVAACLREALSPAKLSAMTSSLLSVANAMTHESQLSTCRNLVIEADGGRILMMNIPNVHSAMLLAVLCAPQANLGQVLWPVRECSQDIGRALDGIALGSAGPA